MRKRKLIEVSLPLEAINRESAREKSIRHGHPSTLHLWWARRPLAAARAVLFAQLVDDPESRPDLFPTEELQRVERERLHNLVKRLVVWDNVRDKELFAEAHAEILKSTDGNPPPILDPFAGGGSIPLEAQRLGLEAHASDLNPVAVLINKALIEIPPRFCDQPPIYPGLVDSEFRTWKGAQGLAADVRAYGAWMRNEAEKRIGHLYPKAALLDGSKANVIAWIWARTVTCLNPACRAEVPLVSSLDLSRKPGKERWLRPRIHGRRVDFEVATGKREVASNKSGQGAKFSCWVCGSAMDPDAVHQQIDVPLKPPARLLAIAAEGKRQRVYLEPTDEHLAAVASTGVCGRIIRKDDVDLGAEARGTFGGNAQGRRYGFFTFADYFTDRQLIAITTFSNLVSEARDRVLEDGGTGAYADGVATYLGLVVSKMTDRNSTLVNWYVSRESTSSTFARQALPMMWDFAEVEPLGSNTGSFTNSLRWTAEAVEGLGGEGRTSISQADAASHDYKGIPLSTDPPYYDNIGYSDLSDYFYVWLRRSLRSVYPDLFATMLVPKAEELVADAYRHGGRENAKKFFETGFRSVFARAREAARFGLPITVYYAYKQSTTDDVGEGSTGWETFLESMIRTGWEITSTWPLRSELGNRMIASDTNALASSIVLSLRPRLEDAPITDRRGFVAALETELPEALRKLQQGQIAPVDLPQAAIGPGMAVFSRYSRVLENDGSKMTIRSALARINESLDQVLSEQEGDFDPATRFALAWYRQHGYTAGKFGDADNLARARNTSVETMSRSAILTSRASKVELIKPAELPVEFDVSADSRTSNWMALHRLIKMVDQGGIVRAGDFLHTALSRPTRAIDVDLVKELAHLLFRVAEGHGWITDAISFNNLVTSWPEILEAARTASQPGYLQPSLNLADVVD